MAEIIAEIARERLGLLQVQEFYARLPCDTNMTRVGLLQALNQPRQAQVSIILLGCKGLSSFRSLNWLGNGRSVHRLQPIRCWRNCQLHRPLKVGILLLSLRERAEGSATP